MLVPFLAFLFDFLEAEKVANTFTEQGLTAIVQFINQDRTDSPFHMSTEERQRLIVKQQVLNIIVRFTLQQNITSEQVEFLMDAAITSIKKRQRNVAAEIVDALCSFCMHYLDSIKSQVRAVFFRHIFTQIGS